MHARKRKAATPKEREKAIWVRLRAFKIRRLPTSKQQAYFLLVYLEKGCPGAPGSIPLDRIRYFNRLADDWRLRRVVHLPVRRFGVVETVFPHDPNGRWRDEERGIKPVNPFRAVVAWEEGGEDVVPLHELYQLKGETDPIPDWRPS